MLKYLRQLIIIPVLLTSTISLKAQWVSVNNGLYGGNVTSMTVSGTNLFAATGSGVFLSTDNGTSWTAVNNGLTAPSQFYIQCLASSGTNVLVGTPYGVFLSSDNGTSWNAVNSGLTGTNVTALTVIGTNIFAGVYGSGVFLSTNNGTSWSAVNTGLTSTAIKSLSNNGTNIVTGTAKGVFISTNNGSSWASINTGLADSTNVYSLAMTGSNIFAGTQSGGVSLSTNNGSSWAAVNTGLPSTNISFLGISGANIFAGTNGSGVYLSTNNGTSWSLASNGLGYTAGYAYATVKSFATIGSNIFVGTSYDGGGVFLSSNNGTSWTAVNGGITSAEVHSLAASGSNIFAGTGNGVFLSTNGTSWSGLNTGIPQPSDVYSIVINGTSIFAGTYGSGVLLSTDNGTSWSAVNTGLTTPYIYSLAVSGSNIFAGTVGGGVFLSTNNGTNWTAVNTGLTNLTVQALAITGSNIFAGTVGGGVFLSTNNGASWSAVNTGLTANQISSLVINGTNIFAGTFDGGVFLSTNNGTSWTAVNTGLTYSHVEALATSGSYLFAGTNGQVFFSSNNGASWTQVSSVNGLVNTNFPSLVISGTNIMAGTDVGVWSRPLADFAPSITSITPASGAVGTTVTITGTNFDLTPANNIVKFNGTAAVVTASSATSITTTVPAGATTGLVTVKVAGLTATSGSSFTVINVVGPVPSPAHVSSLVDGAGGASLLSPNYAFVSGSYAYVASSASNALEIIDISNPVAPLHVGSISNGTGGALLSNPRNVYVVGNYAYVASTGSNALEIVNVSVPSAPVHAGSIVDGGGSAPFLVLPRAVYVVGNYAYVASTGSNTLEIVDVSNPNSPVHVGSLANGTGGALLSNPRSVFVSGNLAYVASLNSNSLEIIDVTTPASPAHVGSIADGGGVAPYLLGANYVQVSGNYAYIASFNSNALEVVDVSNPASPVHRGSLLDGGGSAPFLTSPRALYVSGNYAYVASLGSNALEVVDITNPSAPAHAGSVQNGAGGALLGSAASTFVVGNYVYMASFGSNALEIISIFGPPACVAASNISASGFTAHWTGVGGATGYQLDVSSDNFTTFISGFNSASESGTSQVITGLVPGTTYQYRVRAVYSVGPSLVSNAISVSTSPVQANQATAITTTGFTANWNSIAGATGYQLDVSTDDFNTFVAGYNSLSVAGTSQVVSGLSPGTSYQYQVRAINAAGTSGSSNVIFATTGTGSSTGSSFELNLVHEGSIVPDGAAFSASSVYVSGNYAYVLANNGTSGLFIFDITNPATPVITGNILDGGGGAPFLGNGSSIYVSGNLAYVTSPVSNSLEIVDVTNPSAPAHIGSVVDGGGVAPFLKNPRSVFVSGTYAYVASAGSGALEIVDVTVPASPTHKGSLTSGVGGALLGSAYSVFVSGNFAYVASLGSNALEIVDVTNPASPIHSGSAVNGTGAVLLTAPNSIYVSGNYAYITGQNSNNLEIIDITNPASPIHASSIVDGGGAAPFLFRPASVFVNGNHAFVASVNSNAVEVIDVTNPLSPAHAGSIVNGAGGASLSFPNSVFVSGSNAFVTTSSALEIIDISLPATPVHKGDFVSTLGQVVKLVSPSDVYVSGNYAYVTSANAFEIVDVSNPASPMHKGSLVDGGGSAPFLSGYNYAVFVSGNYAYVTNDGPTNTNGTLEIIDISNPAAPVHKGSLLNGVGGASLVNPWGLYVSGNYAYVADFSGPALEIVDVSNPAAPVHAGSIALTGPTSVFVVGNYAYVPDGNSLKIIDVSNPASPVIVGSMADGAGVAPFLTAPQWINVVGQYAYVPSYGTGSSPGNTGALEIIDISNPTLPVHKGAILDGNGAAPYINLVNYFSISGNYAYFPSGATPSEPSGALEVIDISNPAVPKHAGSLTDGVGGAKLFKPWSVFASGNYAYAVSGGNSLEITSIFSPSTPPVATAASNITTSGFTANWTSVSGAAGYQLDISRDNFTTFVTNYNSKSESTTSDVVTGLSANGNYQYRLRAFDASGTSSNSNVISVSVLPTAPVATAASLISFQGFTANWDSVANSTNYFIDIASDAGFSYLIPGYNNLSVPASQRFIGVTGLSAGTTYYYRIRAANAGGTSANSNVISILTLPTAPYANLATNISTTGFTANWNVFPNAIGYQLDVTAHASDFNVDIPGDSSRSVSGTSQVITGLLPGVKYRYQVRSVNLTGPSQTSSNVVLVETSPLPAAPATGISSTGFTANWSSIPGATGYQLDVSTDNFNTFVAGYNSLTVAGTSQAVSGLSTGVTYQYQVRATSALGVSGNSNIILATTTNGSTAGTSYELNPTHSGSLLADGAWLYPLSIAVAGNYAYAPSSGGLEIADVSNPLAPVHKAKYPLSVNGQYYVAVSGNYVYVGNLIDGSIEIVNVSNPAAPVHAATYFAADELGGNPGARYISVIGNYAYVISSYGLEIIDVTNPAVPVHKGGIANKAGGAQLSAPRGLFVSGNYAYVASRGSNALEIIDISNPASPIHAGSLSDGGGVAPFLKGAYSVYVSGHYAYVGSTVSNVLEIVDVSNPAAPVHAGSLANGVGGALLSYPQSVFVSGNYCYVSSSGSSALEIVDITTPTAPVHAASLVNGSGGAIIGNSWCVYVSGNYAYLTDGGGIASEPVGGIEIVDISSPTSPIHASTLLQGAGGTVKLFGASSVYVSKNLAYVTAGVSNALEIIDVTNASSPVHKGSISHGTGGAFLKNPNSVFVSGTNAIVASSGSNALEIIDVTNAAAPANKGSILDGGGTAPFLNNPQSVFVSGNFAYVASYGSNALEIVNITNPAAPVHMGSIVDGGGSAPFLVNPQSVYVSGNYAYVASYGSNALEIINVSNPAAPVHAGSISDGGGAAPFLNNPQSVFVSGNYAYVTSVTSLALEIIDVTNPNAPVHKGSISDGGGVAPYLSLPDAVYVSGNFAYVTDGNNNALEVVDVTNPATPIHAGSITDGSGGALLGSPTSVYFYGNHAYVTDNGSQALEIVSIFNPAPATPVASVATSISSTGFTIGWNSISGATGYQLDISTDNFNTFVTGYNSASVGGTSQVVTGLTAGTTYQYQVRAIGPSGITGNSNSITGVTIPPVPVAGPADTNPKPTTFVAKWGAAQGATGYNINVATDSTFSTNILSSYNNLALGNITSIELIGLANTTTYYYQVSASNAGGTSAFSRPISVTTTSLQDSLALVALYNATNGANWTNKTNWLTGYFSTWFGVTMSGPNVTGINLSSNNLVGTIPAAVSNLSHVTSLNLGGNQLSGPVPSLPSLLQKLNLSNNKLTALPTLPSVIISADLSQNKLTQLGNMTTTSVDTLKVQNNQLAFGDLESNIAVPVFTYSPQDSVDVAQSVLEQVNTSYTFNASVSGTANTYQWEKNGTNIAGATGPSLTFPNITFADDATYTYSATNSIVTGLTLYGHKKILRVSSLQRDSIALVALFLATNGSGWTNKTKWATTPITSGWFGVTISNNRVVAVNLPNNNLTGVVPVVFADVQQLTTVDLSHNNIKSLPDLTVIPGLATLNVSSNALDFASLIANTAITGINYPNQANLGVPIDTLVNYGTNYNLSVSTKGAGNVYQWTRNGVPVTGATDTTFLIAAINRGNMGTYVCQITNPAVPALTLQTNSKRVRAVATLSGKFSLPDSTAINRANMLLFKINLVGKYDTLANKPISADGTFLLDKVVLDDYELLGKPDTIAFPTALPTYYKSTVFWEVADTLSIQGNRTGLDIFAVTKPTPPKGNGSISGTLEEGGSSSGREEGKHRVAGAGVSASRAEGAGRTQTTKYILVEYTQTNQNGEFLLDHLLTGGYRLNVQYPGYPMDTTSFINFSIGSLPSDKQVIVDASVTSNKIVVTLLKITGLEEGDHRFSIYPNPTKIAFNIDLNESMDNVEYMISTTQGQTIKTGKLTQAGPNRIDVSTLSAGVYLVDLVRNGEVIKNFRMVLE